MRWYVSYPILATGLAFGFDTFFPDAPDLSRPAEAQIQARSVVEPPVAPTVLTATENDALPATRLAAFSPGAKLLAVKPEPTVASTSVLDYLAQTLMPRDAAPARPTSDAVVAWTSAIVRHEPTARDVPKEARLDKALSRVELARDIQRELQRVGCYLGEIDGVWGGGSKRAIAIFMDRVNAALPTREPDVFMLSLLRGQDSSVCGASCPRGQSLTASGRCVPSTLVAQADSRRQSAPPAEAWEPVVAEADLAPRPVPYGRMSIGGPKADDVAELSSGWSRVTGEPARTEQFDRTAALDMLPETDDPGLADARGAGVASSSFDSDAIPVRRSKPEVTRAKRRASAPRRTSTYRQVQRLFQHPLGRM